MGLEGLNPQQLEAVTTDERTVLCLAAAGSGKTKTLVHKVEYLVNVKGVDPKSILSLTFTNAAAFEMRERYKVLPDVDLSKGVPEFRTFHSFCYSLIIKDPEVRKRIGYTKIPTLCDEEDMRELKTRVKLQIGCDLTENELEHDILLSREKEDQKKLYQKALRKEIKKENVITFDIMCYTVCEMFEKNDPTIVKYKEKYTYLNVDEAQDCDPKQFRFVSSFPATTSVFMVGDILQCIYRFRGCTNEYIKKLATAPGWQLITLYENYRSTNQICEFANKFSSYAKDEYRIPMKGQRDGDNVEVIYGSNTNYNTPVDIDHLSILVDKILANKTETAVLCRTNKECAAVKSALNNAGVEYSSSNKSTDALQLLNSALSNDYMLGWLTSLLEPKDYGDYIRLSAQVDNPDLKWFLGLYAHNSKVKAAAEKVRKIREITLMSIKPEEKFEKITKLLRVKSKCSFEGDDNTTDEQIVKQIIARLEDLSDNSIYIGTIHSSKGLEYDTVYLMGVNDTMFRLGDEDNNNLYYVGITRAKNHLTVFRR